MNDLFDIYVLIINLAVIFVLDFSAVVASLFFFSGLWSPSVLLKPITCLAVPSMRRWVGLNT